MISGSFYTDIAGSRGCGMTADQYTDVYTNAINNIPNFMDNKLSAYWLGYISIDNLPLAFHYSVGTYDTENGFVFTDTTKQSNFPCGYCVGNRTPGTTQYGTPQYEINQAYDNNGIFTPSYTHIGLFNSLHPEYSGYATYDANNRSSFYMLMYVYDTIGNFVDRRSGNLKLSSTKSYYDFFNNDEYITFSVAGHRISVWARDFDETPGTCYLTAEDGYHIRLFLVNYTFNFGKIYNGSMDVPDIVSAFMTQVDYTDDNDDDNTGLFFGNQGTCMLGGEIARVYNNNSIRWSAQYWNQYGGGRSGLNGHIPYQAYIDLRSSGYTYGYVYDGNVLLEKNSNDYIFYCLYPIDEIKKHFSLMYRVDMSNGGNTPSYVLDQTYATHVTANNEFTATLKTGNITDAAFKFGLRQWQYSDIAANDFTENDVPPYDPTPATEDEETGQKITRPASLGVGGTLGLVTQYSLTAAQVSELGTKLWTSFLDPDYYKNYLFTLALDTGSFNMASLLSYFISLRVYPFPLINVPSHAAAGNSMFIGAGTVPLNFTATLHTINNYADYIDAGSLTVPRHYGDFRDYTDAEYSIYLPYCGTVQLNPGDVVGNILSAQYAIDFATGACIAYVDVATANGYGYPIAALPGHIGADVPLTATNAGQVAATLAGDAMHIAQIIGNVPSTQISAGLSGFAAANQGNVGGAAGSLASVWTAPITGAAQYAQHLATMATRPAIGIPMLSGGRGFGSFGAPQTAYLQIRRGLYKQPSNYNHTIGTPSTESRTIGSVQGLITAYVDTSTLTATAAESAEIAALLKSGVIV